MKLAGKILLILLWITASSGAVVFNCMLNPLAGEEPLEQAFEEPAGEETEEKSDKKEKDPELPFSVLDNSSPLLAKISKYYFHIRDFSSPSLSIYSPPPQLIG